MFSKRRTYLDRAAGATPNPSSPHAEGREAKRMLDAARRKIADLVEAQADDVIFTSGATEANTLAIQGCVHAHARKTEGKKKITVFYLPSAHASIVENAKMLASYGVAAEPLPIKEWRVDAAALGALISDGTALVTMEAVCGETGNIWNTREVADVLRKAGYGTLLHVDASQAPLSEKIARSHFGADLLTLDASKVGDVRGIGALISHRTIPLMPIYAGGGQERGLRPGSEAPELASQFADSLAKTVMDREQFRARALKMREGFIAFLKDTGMPNVRINEGRAQVPHIVNLSLLGRDTDYLVALLDEAGFAVSTRSACETDSEEGSRSVFALTLDSERAKSTLRISWGPEVKEADLRRFGQALAKEVAFVDRAREG